MSKCVNQTYHDNNVDIFTISIYDSRILAQLQEAVDTPYQPTPRDGDPLVTAPFAMPGELLALQIHLHPSMDPQALGHKQRDHSRNDIVKRPH